MEWVKIRLCHSASSLWRFNDVTKSRTLAYTTSLVPTSQRLRPTPNYGHSERALSRPSIPHSRHSRRLPLLRRHRILHRRSRSPRCLSHRPPRDILPRLLDRQHLQARLRRRSPTLSLYKPILAERWPTASPAEHSLLQTRPDCEIEGLPRFWAWWELYPNADGLPRWHGHVRPHWVCGVDGRGANGVGGYIAGGGGTRDGWSGWRE